jgi:Flp pilus assembly protein TadD
LRLSSLVLILKGPMAQLRYFSWGRAAALAALIVAAVAVFAFTRSGRQLRVLLMTDARTGSPQWCDVTTAALQSLSKKWETAYRVRLIPAGCETWNPPTPAAPPFQQRVDFIQARTQGISAADLIFVFAEAKAPPGAALAGAALAFDDVAVLSGAEAMQAGLKALFGVPEGVPEGEAGDKRILAMRDFPFAGGLRTWDSAKESQATKALRDFGDQDPRLTLARLFELDGDNQRAAALWSAIAATRSGDASAQFELALALNRAGQLTDALGAFRASLAINPQLPGVRTQYATTLAQLGQVAEAETEFRRTIADFPNDAQSRINLAVLLVDRLGSRSTAIALLKEALKLDPASASAQHNLALAAEFERGVRQRLQQLKTQAAKDPQDALIAFETGVAFARLGELEPAAVALRRAATLNPASKPAYQNLATVLVLLQRKEAAQKLLAEAQTHGHSFPPEFVREFETYRSATPDPTKGNP